MLKNLPIIFPNSQELHLLFSKSCPLFTNYALIMKILLLELEMNHNKNMILQVTYTSPVVIVFIVTKYKLGYVKCGSTTRNVA